MEAIRELSESFRKPQLKPADHCYVILQDHGPNDGGWGPAAVILPWEPRPSLFVYTGNAPHVLSALEGICQAAAQATGKTTLLARFTQREDVFMVSGAS